MNFLNRLIISAQENFYERERKCYQFCRERYFHIPSRVILHVTIDMAQTTLLLLRRNCATDFYRSRKIHRPRLGLNPEPWDPEASTFTP
uniref:Uncharacterized protein n=1 Tax=Timema genevievae TaxID=629358 RepID=A0A7R9K7S7_TIMGE|nr:unnamed protein product [Timema genevievae]